MRIISLIVILITSAIIISIASLYLTKKCEKIATRFNFSQALFGIITALGANSPEISSSIFALSMNHHEIGLGVIIGSNIINLAGLLGISAIITGQIKLGLPALILNGGVGFLTIVIMALLLFDKIEIWTTFFLLAILLAPYIYLISRQPSEIKNMKISQRIKSILALTVKHSRNDVNSGDATKLSFIDFLIAAIALLTIIGGSFALVLSAIELANHWGISYVIVGTLILAGLTSIPNIVTAVLLARKGLGVAVVSETFNSNTLNFITGICLPLLIFGMGKVAAGIKFSIFWLLGMTLVTIVSLSFPKGLRRLSGIGIVALYIVYALIVIFYP
ncbi:MAG TPA: hypothetical protein VIJ46_00500 [Rhabdochlamydiaceae bacterium]